MASLNAHRGDSGFSILEALTAVIILGVAGLALHNATLAGVRWAQAGKAHAEQTRQLEYALDWARANACLLAVELDGPGGTFALTQPPLHVGNPATFTDTASAGGSGTSGELEELSLRVVQVHVPGVGLIGDVYHVFLLDVGSCAGL